MSPINSQRALALLNLNAVKHLFVHTHHTNHMITWALMQTRSDCLVKMHQWRVLGWLCTGLPPTSRIISSGNA